MPEWTTPELWPVWWVAISVSFSSTARRSPGRSCSRRRAVASPRMPAPTTTTSYALDPFTPPVSTIARREGPAGARRGRALEHHRRPGGDPARATGGDRRRDHDVAARLGALRRRGRQACDGRALGRRPARLARRAPASRLSARPRPREGAGAA